MILKKEDIELLTEDPESKIAVLLTKKELEVLEYAAWRLKVDDDTSSLHEEAEKLQGKLR